jgi:hypothetical protein
MFVDEDFVQTSGAAPAGPFAISLGAHVPLEGIGACLDASGCGQPERTGVINQMIYPGPGSPETNFVSIYPGDTYEFVTDPFGSLAAFEAAYPAGMYLFKQSDSTGFSSTTGVLFPLYDSASFLVGPASLAPDSYAALQGMDAGSPPLLTIELPTLISGLEQTSLTLTIAETGGRIVQTQTFNNLHLPLGPDTLSFIPAGLRPGTSYVMWLLFTDDGIRDPSTVEENAQTTIDFDTSAELPEPSTWLAGLLAAAVVMLGRSAIASRERS